MQSTTLIFAFVAFSYAGAAKVKLDTLTSPCSRSDPNLGECIKKASMQIFPHLVKGIRDYNFPPVDPLKIPFLALSQSDGPVGLKLNISDTVHEGIRFTEIKSAKADLKKNHMELVLYFPRYSITGICDLGGRILLLPISGHGPCNLTASAMEAHLNINGKMEQKHNKNYFKMEDFVVNVKFTKGSFLLEGLFGGNKELGATMNRFLNENALEVLNEMKSTLETVWGQLFGGLIKRIFESVPYDDLFKP